MEPWAVSHIVDAAGKVVDVVLTTGYSYQSAYAGYGCRDEREAFRCAKQKARKRGVDTKGWKLKFLSVTINPNPRGE